METIGQITVNFQARGNPEVIIKGNIPHKSMITLPRFIKIAFSRHIHQLSMEGRAAKKAEREAEEVIEEVKEDISPEDFRIPEPQPEPIVDLAALPDMDGEDADSESDEIVMEDR